MEKKLKFINLEYSESDIEYIDELCKKIDNSCEEVVNFFGIENFENKISVKLWNDIDEFRKFHQKLFHKREVSTYVNGFSIKNNIHTLSLDEYRKTKGRENATLENLKQLIVHEFTHSVHSKLHDNQVMIWLTEGLATFLSHQYDNNERNFNATLEQVKTGVCPYINYYTMFCYVIETYGKNYILRLINNEIFLENETDRLYEEVNQLYGNSDYK